MSTRDSGLSENSQAPFQAEEDEAAKLEALRAAIAVGLEDVEEGRVTRFEDGEAQARKYGKFIEYAPYAFRRKARGSESQ